MYIGHKELDESFLNVEHLHQTRETRFKDVLEMILIEKPTQSGVGSLGEDE
jgi:hypothetical protein